MKRASVILLFLSCLAPAAFAQNIAYFPRVVATANSSTGLALSNPTADPASVTLTLFNKDGVAVGSPAIISVGSGGQIARLSTELFPTSQGQRGWVQMSSPVQGIAGFYLNGDFVTTTDGGEFASAGRSITFPWIVESGSTSTEVTLTNPGDGAVTVSLTLFGADGSIVKTATQNMGAKAQIIGTIQALLGVAPPFDVGYLRVVGSGVVLGAEVVQDGTKDIAALNARVDAPSRSLVFPHIATGGGYSTALFVQNAGSVTQIVTLQFFLDSGSTGAPDVTLSLAPGQLLRRTVQDLFNISNPALQTGWARATAAGESLEGFQVFLAVVPGGITALPAQKTASTRLLQSHIAEETSTTFRNEDLFTGLAILNPNDAVAAFTVSIVTRDAVLLTSNPQSLQPRQKLALLLREMMPEALGETGGTVWIQSNGPIFALQVFGTWNLGLLSQIPAQSTELVTRLATPATDRFAISGRISTALNTALGGIRIDAIGPQNGQATTDYSGAFVVKNLPQGNYAVTPSRSDLVFTPTSDNFAVSGSVRSAAFTAIAGTSPPPTPPVVVPPATPPGGTGTGGTGTGGTAVPIAVSPAAIDVSISSATPVGSYQATINFDAAILSLDSSGVTGGSAPFGQLAAINIDNVAGTATINQFQTAGSPTGTFVVAHLRFSGKAAGTATLSISRAVVTDVVNGILLPSASISLSASSVRVQ